MSRFVMRPVATGIKFDLLAANGQVIATSEVYKTAAACRKGIGSVRANAPGAALELPETEKPAPNPKFQVFRDRAGQYRFRLKARNGAVIAVSEGYATRAACLGGVESVRVNAAQAAL